MKKLLCIVTILGLFALSGCAKKEESKPTTPDPEAKPEATTMVYHVEAVA